MLKAAVAIIASALLAACAQGATRATEVLAKIDVGASGPCSVAFEAGAAWATVFRSNEVVRIDPATNAVTHRITTDAGPCGITAGAGALWVMTNAGSTVQRIDPAAIAVSATIPVGAGPYDVLYAFDSVWVTNYADGTIHRIDPTTNRVVRRIRIVGAPAGLAATRSALWVGDASGKTIVRINPARTGSCAGSRPAARRPSGWHLAATSSGPRTGSTTRSQRSTSARTAESR